MIDNRFVSQEAILEALEEHKKWVLGFGGKRINFSYRDLIGADLSEANLRRANLSEADLRRADLRRADLRRADLSGADLKRADLRRADLSGADLKRANLRRAGLSGANLIEANLSEADLSGADLIEANLRGADLRGADLRGADLSGANLSDANLSDANLDNLRVSLWTLGYFSACPEEGSYVGFKAAGIDGIRVIVKLVIPEDAKRSSATTRKCRASKARVVSITSTDGRTNFSKASSLYNPSFTYTVGETVAVEKFDENRWNECATGIHHFLTREEAILYMG